MSLARSILFGTASLLFLVFFLEVQANASDITVSPMRVIFEKGEREAEISLVNLSDEPGAYRLSLMNYVQTKSEGMSEVTGAAAKKYTHFADKMIRFSPRQVELAPRGTQVVRLQLRLPPKLKPGEYRTHLAITNVPKPSIPDSFSKEGPTKKRMRVSLTVVNRLAIPILIRRGDETVAYGLENLKLDITGNKTPSQLGILRFTLVAKGSRSSFSDVEVTFRPEKELEEYPLAKMASVAIYYPNTERDLSAELVVPPQVKGKKGRITVTVKNPDNNQTFVAQATLDIPTKP